MLISIRFCTSCSSIACKSEWNHSAVPKSRITQVKYTWKCLGEKTMGKKRAHLGKTRRLGVIEVVHAIPNRLENPSRQRSNNVNLEKQYPRGKRSNSNTSTDEEHGLILQKVLRCRAKGTVHHDTREDAV